MHTAVLEQTRQFFKLPSNPSVLAARTPRKFLEGTWFGLPQKTPVNRVHGAFSKPEHGTAPIGLFWAAGGCWNR